jgi:hypothetical protein
MSSSARTYRCRWFIGSLVVLAAACGPSGSGDDGGDDDGTPACTNGSRQCVGSFLQECEGGAWKDLETCTASCSPTLGCVVCVPGTATCSGSTATVCNGEGSGTNDFECDPVQGMTCDPSAGGCTGDCAAQSLGSSYIGCEYHATVTANPVVNNFDFAVAIANTGARPARVQIENGALGAPRVVMVEPRSVSVQRLPWVATLKACNLFYPNVQACPGTAVNITTLAPRGSYWLRSDAPVTVYQFNPLDYVINTMSPPINSFSNDASLLLPTNVWRNKYIVAAWHFGLPLPPIAPLPPWPGLMAITASEDNTMVTVTPRAPTSAGGGVPAMQARQPTTLVLNAGDALQLGNTSGDLTGSLVEADKPVQVTGGHLCTFLPDGVRACDHIEESMFSVDALGKSYVVAPPAMPTLPDGKRRVVRFIAAEDSTVLTFDPPQTVGTTLAQAGDFVELYNDQYYTVKSEQKFMVSQYMSAQEAGGNMGDPAMALAVPVEQFRREYLFHAPTNYQSSYVDVVARQGVTVMLDGVAIPAGRAVGTDGWTVTGVQLTRACRRTSRSGSRCTAMASTPATGTPAASI